MAPNVKKLFSNDPTMETVPFGYASTFASVGRPRNLHVLDSLD
jgi:hypothetical protein